MIYSGLIITVISINFTIQLLKKLIRNTENLGCIMKLLSVPGQNYKYLLCLWMSEINYSILVFYNLNYELCIYFKYFTLVVTLC